METTAAAASAVCDVCWKRRSERRDIIGEIFETEVKYGRDLRIVLEEFHRPMLVAGLLTSDQLAGIFLNTDELIQVRYFCRAQRLIRQPFSVYFFHHPPAVYWDITNSRQTFLISDRR